MGRRLRPDEATKLCRGGLHRRALGNTLACMQCAAITALDDLIAVVVETVPAASGAEQLHEIVAAAAWTGAQRRSLAAHLRAHPDALSAGTTTTPVPAPLARLSRALVAAGAPGVVVPQPPRHPCPSGRHERSGWTRDTWPCTPCLAAAAFDDAVALVVELVPSLPAAQVRSIVARAARSRTACLDLAAHLRERADALSSGSSDVPRPVVEVVNALIDAGAPGVARLVCVGCGTPAARLDNVTNGGRLCTACHHRRRPPELCGACKRVRPVAARGAGKSAVCSACYSKDPTHWEQCSRCGTDAQVIVRIDGQVVGRCCYAPPVIRCTMCGAAKGTKPWKSRRPVCGPCAPKESTPCSVCSRAAPIPTGPEIPVCALCRTSPAEACRGCGVMTPGRDRRGRPRCPDCYRRRVSPCGRCGRARAVVRLATGDDPDLCGICWTGPTVACESCGEVRPCRGERRGRMLCTKCAPVTPQSCAHCGRLRPVNAQWIEGPVCGSCYARALRAKDSCPGCGRWRRLRTYAGIATKVCSDCAGVEPHAVCGQCGVEDYLHDRGRCAACSLGHRLERIFGDRHQCEASGLAPVHDALARLGAPRDVIRWLHVSAVTRLLHDMATGELAVGFDALDALPRSRAVWFVENLLTTAGVLPGRDPILARFELWVAEWLDAIEVADAERLLRRYATWEVLRPLRLKSARRPLSDSAHNGAKTRLKACRNLLGFIGRRGHAVDGCRQADLDTWAAGTPKSTVRAARPFWNWAVRHRLVPDGLDYPGAADAPRGVAPSDAWQWDLARHLLHDDGVDDHHRVAGLFVVLYAQPVSRIARMTQDDIVATPSTVTVRLGRTPITVPEPLAGHVRSLLVSRQATSATMIPGGPGWLFPGQQPGRPMHANALTKRLGKIGVPVGVTRGAALAHLTASMPAAVVADLLGVHCSTAALWAKSTGRTWADYTANRPTTTQQRLP